MEQVERGVIEACQQGRVEQFKVLYDHYKDFVYNLSYRFTLHEEQAEDLTQNIFITVYKTIKSFRFQADFSTWLYRLSLNQLINDKKKTGVFSKLEENEAGLERKSIGSFQDYEAGLENREKVRLLLKPLMPEEKILLILKEAYEMEYEKIADLLQIAPGTVKSKIHRIKERIRKTMKNLLAEEPIR